MREHRFQGLQKESSRVPLERVDEILNRNKASRWTIIKEMLDEYFKNVFDNWWTVTRHEVHSYAAFKVAFNMKYWSGSTQNIIRDNIRNGKYDHNTGQSMTAYFWERYAWRETWSQLYRKSAW